MIDFFKYNSSGNDFIIIDNRTKRFKINANLIKQMCHRKFGLGADGLIFIEPSSDANYFMNYFNSDGLPSSLCGNGSMCCAHLAKSLGLLEKQSDFFIGLFATREGVFNTSVGHDNVTVSLPNVSSFKTIDDDILINTGSPHFVKFTSFLEKINVNKEGKKIRYNSPFAKDGVNVNFVQSNEDGIFIRTYERGVESETLSCGTGVVAAVLSLFLSNKLSTTSDVIVNAKGGPLKVSYEYDILKKMFYNISLSNKVHMVFKGQTKIN